MRLVVAVRQRGDDDLPGLRIRPGGRVTGANSAKSDETAKALAFDLMAFGCCVWRVPGGEHIPLTEVFVFPQRHAGTNKN